jgi:hypothetical protein
MNDLSNDVDHDRIIDGVLFFREMIIIIIHAI